MKTDILSIYANYTDVIPDELLSAFSENKCVALIGSGVSRRCLAKNRNPLPSWIDLLLLLIKCNKSKKVFSKSELDELKKLINRKEFLLVAQELLDRLPVDDVNKIIIQTLDPDKMIPSRLHELLMITPFKYFLTTNYDNLLERSYIDVWNRYINCFCLDKMDEVELNIKNNTSFILKLHGDFQKPESLVLGQKNYQGLLQNDSYISYLDNIFINNSVLMIGYSLNDIDIQLALDRINTQGTRRKHFLLMQKSCKTEIEKNRLLQDRNVQVIEYIDYFGLHNHVETFFEALNTKLSNEENLKRIKEKLRRRISIFYPDSLKKDGLFIWNLLFREGSITLCKDAQCEQENKLNEIVNDENVSATDYIIFLVDNYIVENGSEYLSKIKKTIEICIRNNVLVLLLAINVNRRIYDFFVPVFYLEKQFSEKDLVVLLDFIKQDAKKGFRHN